MKVKDLIVEIGKCKQEYGESFLDWDIYTEQIDEADKRIKINGLQKDWGRLTDGDGWEYFACVGFWTKFPDKKIFTVNVNY